MNDNVWKQTASSVPASVGGWSRLLGVSLRPWSGRSPLGLIVRGVIRVALCIFFAVVALRVVDSDELAAVTGDSGRLRLLAGVIIIALAVGGVLGVLSVVVGVLDMMVRRTVTGTVVSLSDRRFLDFLPHIAQRMIFERNPNQMDKRRVRTEVVLDTDNGHQQWTVRKTATLRELRPGTAVTLTVTPLAGYVAQVTPAHNPSGTF